MQRLLYFGLMFADSSIGHQARFSAFWRIASTSAFCWLASGIFEHQLLNHSAASAESLGSRKWLVVAARLPFPAYHASAES